MDIDDGRAEWALVVHVQVSGSPLYRCSMAQLEAGRSTGP